MNSRSKERKAIHPKTAVLFIIIGLIVMIAGIIFLSRSIDDFKYNKEQYNIEKSEYNSSLAEYESECDRIDDKYDADMEAYYQEYNEWAEKWLHNNATMADKPTMPTKENYPDKPSRKFGSILNTPKIPVMLPISIIIIILGLSITCTKIGQLKRKKSLTNNSETTTHIHEEFFNTDIKNKEPESPKNNDDSQKYCIYCGNKVDPDSKKCPGCGKTYR